MTITFQQLVYDWGRTPAAIAQARCQQVSTQDALSQTQQDVINQTKQDFYTLLQNQHLVDVQHENLVDQQAHLDLANARFKAGVRTARRCLHGPDRGRPSPITLTQAVTTAELSRVDLNNEMGLDARTPTVVLDMEEPRPELPPVTELVEQAFCQRPEIAQLEAAVWANLHGIKVAAAGNKPRIFYEVTATPTGSSFFSGANSQVSFGLGLSWLFLDGGLTKGAVQTAEGNLLTAQAQLCQGKSNISQEVVRAYLNVQSATVQVTTADIAVKSAQESERLQRGRYAAGVGTLLDVLDAQSALVQAEVSQVTARYGLSLARAALAHALGEEEC